MDDQENTSRPLTPTPRPSVATPPPDRAYVSPSTSPSLVPQRKKRKGLLIGLIIAAVLLLAVSLLYALWFQNPNKVVSDGIMQAINAKTVAYTGTIAVVGDTKMNVTLDGKGSAKGNDVNAKMVIDAQGKKYTLEGSGVMIGTGDLYFKIKNIDDLINNYRSAIPAESQPLFDKIIAKINDKWIKVSSDDLKSYSEDVAKAQKCTTDAVKKIQDDAATKSELMAIYKNHPFITIDKSLGGKDGSFGYVLTSDKEKAKTFATALKETAVYKTLQKCDNSFTINENDLTKQDGKKGSKADVEVWVHQWTHQITKVVLKDDSSTNKTTMAIETTFNQPVTIATPKDATTLEQLQKDITDLLGSGSTAASN
jgi:hypothetical protein